MRSDTTLLYNIMTFSLFFACRRPLPGVPAALPCGRHHVYIYHIVRSLLMHAYFDQLGIHPHPQHKLDRKTNKNYTSCRILKCEILWSVHSLPLVHDTRSPLQYPALADFCFSSALAQSADTYSVPLWLHPQMINSAILYPCHSANLMADEYPLPIISPPQSWWLKSSIAAAL